MKSGTGQATAYEGKGLACPACGCRHFEVLYTRGACGGKIVRRRACRHCGRRLTTTERVTG